MKNEITDKDALKYAKANRERLGMATLTIYSSEYKTEFAGYVDEAYEVRIAADTMAELEAKRSEMSPEKIKREKLAKLRSEAAELARELGEEA